MQILRAILSLFFLLSFTSKSLTQTILISQEIESLKKSWGSFYFTLKNDSIIPNENAIALFQKENSINQLFILKQNIKRAEANSYRHDPGLRVNANYLENFNPAINDDDDNLIYNRRWQAGVNWDILNNGIYDNKLSAKKLENDLYIEKYQNQSGVDKNVYTDIWNNIIYVFNSRKIELLKKRQKLLIELEVSANQLYFLKYLSRENYFEILARKTEVESMFRIYQDYNLVFEKLGDSIFKSEYSLPVFDIHYDTLFSLLNKNQQVNDTVAQLLAENLKMDKNYLRDISLSLGLRYNYYNLVTDVPPSRSFMSFGVNFSAPIPFNYKQRIEIAEAKAAHSSYVANYSGDEYYREVLNDCYEYRYKLKQLDAFYQKKQILEERLRRLNALKDINDIDFNPVLALNQLDEYLAVVIEINDLLQNLYLKYLRISSYFGKPMSPEFSTTYELPDNFKVENSIHRSIYIWSSEVELHSVAFIREYIYYNKIDNVIVSIKNDEKYLQKLNELTSALSENGSIVELMIGDNKFIFESNWDNWLTQQFSKVKLESINAIHLDVEPHTFDDYKEKSDMYLKKYLEMLSSVRDWCNKNNLKLSVSIPTHYPEEIVNEIFSKVDKVYFMAYENTKIDFIERKLTPYLSQDDKLVIALSVNDYMDRTDLEQQLIDLMEKTGNTNFAIHDLKRLLLLDEKNLEEIKE